MSGYQRINFKDQNVERPKTYDVTNNPDGSITLIESFGNVEELGTPINQDNMNHIEDGIDAVSFSKFSLESTYKKNDLVTDIQENELKIFKSLKENNFGHLPSETDYWEEVEFSGAGGSGLQLFDTILKDHILTYEESKGLALQGTYVYKNAVAGSRYGYPDFYNIVLAEKENADPTEVTLGENTITIHVNANGHQYYDIADKEAIDSWFNTYGLAWFYGIDEENERILMPRKNLLELTPQSKVSIVGNGMTLGLTNGTNNYGLAVTKAGDNYVLSAMDGAYGQSAGTASDGERGLRYNYGITTDPTKSGIETYLNDYEAQNQYLYICVGNTTSTSAITDYVDVTTTENDTIPLGYSVYRNTTQASVSWLKSEGQWNDGNIYKTFYNEFLKKIGEDFAKGKVVSYKDSYTDFDLVINEDDITFRLPLYDGSEWMLTDKYIDVELKESNSTYVAPANGWFNINMSSSDANQRVAISIVGKTATNDSDYSSQKGQNLPANVFVVKGETVKLTWTAGGGLSFFRFSYATGNGSLYFKVANAVENLELLDAGEVLESLADKISRQDCSAYITESYVNGTSGYIKYSNGYYEEWGLTNSGSATSGTVTFLNSFKNTNFVVTSSLYTPTSTDTAGIDACVMLSNYTLNGFRYSIAGGFEITWKACGYIA